MTLMKTRYTVLDGEIIAEKRSGVRKQYAPDPLGSTVALLDSSQAITDTFSYWPYGEERTRTGSTPTPFRFVGTLGYHRSSVARTYVRARELSAPWGRWLSHDPLAGLGAGSPYLYSAGNPIRLTDRSGLRAGSPGPPRPAPGPSKWPGDYGHYCGYTRHGQGGGPVDCIDAAVKLMMTAFRIGLPP